MIEQSSYGVGMMARLSDEPADLHGRAWQKLHKLYTLSIAHRRDTEPFDTLQEVLQLHGEENEEKVNMRAPTQVPTPLRLPNTKTQAQPWPQIFASICLSAWAPLESSRGIGARKL